MHPSWGGFGGGHQPPPHFGPRPHQFRAAQPPPPTTAPPPQPAGAPPPGGGGFAGYGAPSFPPSNFSSLHEQHLQQMQQLQQLHQKQLQSVLHHSGNNSNSPSPYWQAGGAGPAAPPNSFQAAGPQPQPPPPEVKPPAPEPPPPAPAASKPPAASTPQVSDASAPVGDEKPDFSKMSMQEQQEYWYQQHLQNLQKLKNEKAKQNQGSFNESHASAPPPPVEPPKSTPPPPPPKEEPPPPPPPDESQSSSVNNTGDPAEAARLQQLQVAAAQWQQVQHQRASFQYQALMQEHAQLQQILQQYQQVIQQPAHLQTMPFEMQLQHYEMQQQRFAPLYQEWERHFNLWLEQFQMYPHKDQLHDYEAQWRQWQEQMNSTSAHLQERVTTLRAMQHQYGSSYGMMGSYGQQSPNVQMGPNGNMNLVGPGTPSMPPPVTMDAMPAPSTQGPSQSGPVVPQGHSPSDLESISETCKTGLPPGHGVRPPGPGVRPPGPGVRPPGPGVRPPGPGVRPPGPGVRPPGPGVGPPGPGAGPGVGQPRPGVRPPGPGVGPPGPQGVRPYGPGGRPPGPGVRPSGPGSGPPGPHGRFDGPRFEGPRGPQFEQPPQQRFSGPPRFDAGQRFSQPPRGNPPFPGAPARLENPPRQNTPTRFERPPVASQQTGSGQQSSPVTGNQTKQQSAKPEAKPVPPSYTDPDKAKSPLSQSTQKENNSSAPSMTDDLVDSVDGFFIQSGPIPQTKDSDKTDADSAKQDKTKEVTTKPSAPTDAPDTTNKNSNLQPPKTSHTANGPPQQVKPPQNKFKPDTPKETPRMLPMMNQQVPPQMARGRGRGQIPMPLRGRGRARGRGQYGGPMADPNFQREIEEDSYDHQEPGNASHGEDQDRIWRDPSLDGPEEIDQEAPLEIWQPEEEHFPEEYPEDTHQDENWEEEPQDYWEEEDPYWAEQRPAMRARPPFPPGGPRRPPFHPRFMLQGPRRPPPPGSLQHNPLGPPPFRPRGGVVPRFRRGLGPWGPLPRHDMMERDLRRPPAPHEIIAREPAGPHGYEEEIDREPAWPHPRGRGIRRPPLPPHEMGRGIRRPPMRPAMPRERWHGPPPHEEENYEEEYPYGAEDDVYRRPPHEYNEDYEHGDEYYGSREEWDGEQPERDYPPHRPPERVREDPWLEERERSFPYEEDRYREERRGPFYPDDPPYQDRDREPPFHSRSDWERPPPPPPPERGYSRSLSETDYEHKLDPLASLPAPQATDSPLDESSPSATKAVLALSQRQHEIILKAAQELKMIRELQETKKALGEVSTTESAGLPSELPAGILGLEIPPEVKSALQATNLLSETGQTFNAGLSSNQSTDFLSSTAPTASFIAKTVDYAHGRDGGSTVERISYGERVLLRPAPAPSERSYEKELLGHRDPYYDRRSDPYAARDYDREWERDPYREKPTLDYERDRYERDRYLRDERASLGPRPTYREREREHSSRSSRDRELYNRPSYERSSYERSLEHYEHGSSSYGERRSYPDERQPPPTSLPPSAPVAPPVEKKPEIKNAEDILKPPGRSSRPDRIVVIMRGLPGSGKSHVAKLIRDKEVECGGAPPRVLGLDDYFMTEVEKIEKDPDSGKRIKTKVLEYEYEPEMEDTYRSSMLKTFKKTLDDGFFPFIILDAINDKVKYFDQFWSAAKTKGFEVYLAEITTDQQTCAKRNIHGRTLKDISKLSGGWESAPPHMVRLDIRSLLQDAAIEDVEMEDFNPSDEPKAEVKNDDDETDLGYVPKSKWEMDTSEAKLDKLDGLVGGGKRKRDAGLSGMEDFLQLPDDYATRMSEPGKKRVRWADLEEQKDVDRKRAIGFVVGQTDWEKITDESGQIAQRALNRTKYF
ncbi:YLP motif-containing protein 1 isoform X1 [Danio rerio]|uniref:YLP motif-containing protein 1 n=1 Tax=Danio rerio TaxID=7955 RepID=F6P6X1_DANRE|nr:YLP motif-containing protein 1 isoform X1 [Danio rerio]|eukprot:XP_005170211.2 YLP motif-containing protein 1 isoform X1 [Danio rerio]